MEIPLLDFKRKPDFILVFSLNCWTETMKKQKGMNKRRGALIKRNVKGGHLQ